jgi:polyhydroxybutyrate depolymerase
MNFQRHRRARFVRVAAIALLAAALLPAGATGPAAAASGHATSLAAGSSDHTIVVDGRERTFHVYRPAGLTTPAPLVVMLHGGFGTGSHAEKVYGWNAQADANRFLVAYPDGLDRAWSVGGNCCGTPGSTDVKDVEFITAMVKAIGQEVTLDRDRLYATGMSNGGMLAYRLACDTKMFAAIGPVAATLLGTCTDRAPTSVIHVHGTEDENVRYNGEPGEGQAGIDGEAVPTLIAGWRAVGDCAAPARTVANPVITSIAACPAGRAVKLITVIGGGHEWPGAGGKPGALDTTSTIWRFFAQHPKNS